MLVFSLVMVVVFLLLLRLNRVILLFWVMRCWVMVRLRLEMLLVIMVCMEDSCIVWFCWFENC